MPALLAALAIDLAAIAVLAYALYFRRHGRRDLLLGYVALNTGIFAVAAMLAAQRIGLAVGFGLFAVLSIIRLRSDPIAQGEVGYYFVALVLGLVNGLRPANLWIMLMLNVILLGVMYAADHPRLLAGSERRMLTLDVVHEDEAALRADLERRLGGEVRRLLVCEVDYVRDVTVVDVRYRAARRPAATAPPARAADERAAFPADRRPAGAVYRGVRVVR